MLRNITLINFRFMYFKHNYRVFGLKVQLQKPEELVAEPLFCNDNIQVGNRNMFYKKWIDNDVCAMYEMNE